MLKPLRAWVAGALASAAVAGAAPAAEGPQAALERIRLAGTQATLSQQMAGAACYASLGIELDRQLELMQASHDRFSRALETLRHGDVPNGLPPETDTDVLQALSALEARWEAFGAAIASAAAAGWPSEAELAEIARLDGEVLAAADRTARLLRRSAAAQGLPLHRAIALEIAGRQRMLTQQMAKELCYVARGTTPVAARRRLGEAVTLFETSLEALSEGAADVGIRPPEDPALEAQLAAVQEVWEPVAPLLDRVAEGAVPGPVELITMATLNDDLLAETAAALALYAAD